MKRICIYWLLLAMLLLSCGEPAHSEPEAAEAAAKADPGNAKGPALVPVNIKVKATELTDLTENITISGSTLPDTDATFSAESAGRIEYLAADYGDRVKKGKVLARIDYVMQKAQVDQARATFDLAEKTYTRLNQLKDEELISQQQIDEAQANMLQAEAGLKIAEASLRKSLVISTINGVVARKFVEQGEFVAPGAPIFQVVDYSTIVIEADVPERLVKKVKRGDPVTVRIEAMDESFKGNVYVVMPMADHLARTFRLRVKVLNPDFRILNGMAAVLQIAGRHFEQVVVVPQEAVIEDEGWRSVFVEKDGVAIKKKVELGPATGSRVMISSGLGAGERMVVLGQRELVDGQPVHVIED